MARIDTVRCTNCGNVVLLDIQRLNPPIEVACPNCGATAMFVNAIPDAAPSSETHAADPPHYHLSPGDCDTLREMVAEWRRVKAEAQEQQRTIRDLLQEGHGEVQFHHHQSTTLAVARLEAAVAILQLYRDEGDKVDIYRAARNYLRRELEGKR